MDAAGDGDDAADGAAAARIAAHDLHRHLVAVARAALHAGGYQQVAAEAGGALPQRFDEPEAGAHARVATAHLDRPLAPCRGRAAAARRRAVAGAHPLVARLADAAQAMIGDGALEAGAQRLAVIALDAEHAHHVGDGQRPRRLLFQHREIRRQQVGRSAVGAHGRTLGCRAAAVNVGGGVCRGGGATP